MTKLIKWTGLAVGLTAFTIFFMYGLEKSAIISLAQDECAQYRSNKNWHKSCVKEAIREMKADSVWNK